MRRDLREIILIFVGVMIALGANAAWGYHQDRQRERTTLEELLDATRENERLISQAIYEDSMTYAFNTALWQLFQTAGAIDPVAVARYAAAGSWVSDLHPITGTYAAAAQTGDVNTLRNSTLRADIERYSGELDSTMKEWSSIADPISLMIIRDVVRFLPVRALAVWEHAPDAGPPPRMDVQRLRNNPDFHTFLETQIVSSSNRVGLLQGLRAHTTALRKELETELHVSPSPPFTPNRNYKGSITKASAQ